MKRSKRPPARVATRERRAPLPVLAFLLIAAAGIAIYANSLGGPFLLDDQRSIVENTTIRQLWPLTTPLHPLAQSPVTGRPLVNLSFAVNYAAGGLGVEGFHVVNVAIHVLAALVLVGVLSLTFARTRFLGGEPTSVAIAVLCALIWVVHPLNSEAVNYLTQRTELLMGLFYLLTLYSAIRAVERGSSKIWIWMAALSAFCAVGSKETALTLPLVVLLWDRAFQFPSFKAAWAQRRGTYAAIAASWLLFAFFARELPFFAEHGFIQQVSRWTYLLNQAPVITHYLVLSVWPRALVFDYGSVPAIALSAVWPAVVCLLLLLAATVVALFRWPALGFWGAWFFITLAPASSLIPIPTEVGAERRMYLPLIAVIAISGMAVNALRQRLTAPAIRKNVGLAAAAFAIIVLSIVTVYRNADYRSRLAIWQTVLDRWPHARAHEHFALALRDVGRTDEAIAHLRISAPESAQSQHALASALLERGDLGGAIAQFRAFVERKPADPHLVEGREELAVALTRTGDAAAALEQLRTIEATNPTYKRGHVNLAEALFRGSDVDGAIGEYRHVLALDADNVTALAGLGRALGALRRNDEALQVLRRVLELEPRALEPRQQVVRLLLAAQRFPEMEREARLWTSYASSDAEAHNLLGVALASQQQWGPAEEQFEQASRLDPSHQEARDNLMRVRALMRRPE